MLPCCTYWFSKYRQLSVTKYLPSKSVIFYTPIWSFSLWSFSIPMNIFTFFPSTNSSCSSNHPLNVSHSPAYFSVPGIGLSILLKSEVPTVVMWNFLKTIFLISVSMCLLVEFICISYAFFNRSFHFSVLVQVDSLYWSFSCFLLVWFFPCFPHSLSLIVHFLFTHEAPLGCCYFLLSTIFYPTSRVSSP